MSEDKVSAEFFVKYPESVLRSQMSRIWEQINSHWGSQQAPEYLESLLIVEEDRERKGFTPDVMAELLTLVRLHDIDFPEYCIDDLESRFQFNDDKRTPADL